MKKLTSHYIFDGYKLHRNKILVFDENNFLIDTLDFNNNKELENIEFYNGILCPGFVNAHNHLELSFLKDRLKPGTCLDGFIKQMQQVNRTYDAEKLKKIILADNLMFKEGISVCGDVANSSITNNLKKESEIFYYTFVELYSPNENDADLVFENGLKILQEFKYASITPHALYSVSNKLLQKIIQNLKETDILSVHFNESKLEKDLYYYYQPYNEKVQDPHLKFLSFFPANINLLFVHNTFLNELELEYIRSAFNNAYFVICPNSNLFIESVLPPNFLFELATNRICIGTDSLASNNNLSILEELKTLSKNYPSISLEKWLSMATIQGAKALRVDNIYGSFEKYKKPGVVLIENVDLVSLRLTSESFSKRII